MWNIHDFLANGLFVGCVIEGLARCPSCGPTTESDLQGNSRRLYIVGAIVIFQRAILIGELEVVSIVP
jgi:hypothetical protein